jgi:hypothetical protein
MSANCHSPFSRTVACGCACLLLLPVGALAPLVEAGQSHAARMRQLVEAVGVGIEVDLILSGGDQIHGVIRDIAADNLAVEVARDEPARRFSYGDVWELRLARMTYQTSGDTDVAAVRRIVTVVGLGHRVLVTTRDALRVHAEIQAIGTNEFTLHVGAGGPRSFQISYAQVTEIKPYSRSPGKTIGIAMGVVGAILAIWIGVGLASVD